MINAESMRIKESIENLTIEELDKILHDCGIESIKPSIKCEYVKCLNVLADIEYRKNIPQYSVGDEYFEVETVRQEVA